MSYSVSQLSTLAGVSARTLRYYDQIGLLKPQVRRETGYRFYDDTSLERLQLILLYRELDFNLEQIQSLLDRPGMTPQAHLESQARLLRQKNNIIQGQLQTIERTLDAIRKGTTMDKQARFENLKKKQIAENEKRYGDEIRHKYGEETVRQSNERYQNMDKATYDRANALAAAIIEALLQAMETGHASGVLAHKAAALHREWLEIYWPHYSAEYHAGLARMYVEDERFSHYYDQHRAGAAVFMRDAILDWIEHGSPAILS